MATITTTDFDNLRQKFTRWRIANGLTPAEGRACLNAAFQAIEDWYQAHKANGGTRINSATSPYSITFPVEQKKQLFQLWMEMRFNSDSLD